ncbi:MAG: replicative DNA helicase [Prevotellaceae bacterium]|jgi:replicative DNA helicase|nr:replicative DNA helicase [Prevotellaceae bacterium]
MAKTTKPSLTKRTIEAIALESGKMPPHAPDLEKAVLGALMLERDAIDEVQDLLTPKTFHNELHEKIFGAIQSLFQRHEPIDMLTVAQELKKQDDLDVVGGPHYLSQLTMTVGSAAHVEYHAKLLSEKYIQRQLITASSEIQRDAFEEDANVTALLDDAQQKIFEIAEGNIHRETAHVNEIIERAIKALEEAQSKDDGFIGIPSGFTKLDRITQGWQPSDLIIVAARPSMGKTAFVLSMARNITVDHNLPVAFFSLEMSSEQLVKRLMTSEADIASEKIRGGTKMEAYEWQQLEAGLQKLRKAPLYIDDTPALSIYEFRSKARKLVAAHKVQMIFIDYLQLMTGPPELQKGIREQEVSAISRSLKAIAKDLNVPIVALSQLNRSVEARERSKKRPQLNDLRESGAIEQDADLVLFIHRPEYYGLTDEEYGENTEGLAVIIVAKHRNGATGDVRLKFEHRHAKFSDWPFEDADMRPNVSTTGRTYSSSMNDSSKKSKKEKETKKRRMDDTGGGINTNTSFNDMPTPFDAFPEPDEPAPY